MNYSHTSPRTLRSLSAWAITAAVHALLIVGILLAQREPPATDHSSGPRIQYVQLKPAPAKKPLAALPAPPKKRAPVTSSAKPAATPPIAPAPEVIADIDAPSPAVEPARSAADIMQQAKRDLGGIDRDLRQKFPGPRIEAPVNTAQTRLEQGFEAAAAAAPPKWYEAPKVTELVDPAGVGRRRYKVVDTRGTYCITEESNRGPFAIEGIKRNRQTRSDCPKNEEVAKQQKWTAERKPETGSSVLIKSRN
jgi:hypothetical protein